MKNLTGITAIEFAEQCHEINAPQGPYLCRYSDPTESAADGISIAEAREIAEIDPSLIYIDGINPTQWGGSLFRTEHEALVAAMHGLAYGDDCPDEQDRLGDHGETAVELREFAVDAAREGGYHEFVISKMDDDEILVLLDDVHASLDD